MSKSQMPWYWSLKCTSRFSSVQSSLALSLQIEQTLWLRWLPWILGSPTSCLRLFYCKKFPFYLKGGEITMNRSVLSCFLTVSGAQTYDTGRSSLLWGSPETSAFDEMTELLKQHFSLSHVSLFKDPISWMKSSAWWGSAGQFPELSIWSQP